MKILIRSKSILFILWAMSLVGCSTDEQAPDVRHIEASFEWVRFDQALMQLDTARFELALSELVDQYPSFSEIYFERILRLPIDSSRQIQSLLQSEALRALNDSIQLRFSETEDVQQQLAEAFRYYKYYFPEEEAPNVYTSCTEFSVGAFLFTDTLRQDSLKDALGISLEFFLGKGFPYLRLGRAGQSTFSAYMTRTFNKDHLVRKAIQVLVEDQFQPLRDNRLIDFMIQNGAQLVILDHLLPQMADTVLFECTPAQLEWCQNNELQIWAHLIDRDLLYSRRMADIATLIRPAPSSAGMPAESPGQTANYIGYKIVKAYMEQTGAEVKDLVQLRDAQEVLTRSKYKAR
jgi:hypothetical protein